MSQSWLGWVIQLNFIWVSCQNVTMLVSVFEHISITSLTVKLQRSSWWFKLEVNCSWKFPHWSGLCKPHSLKRKIAGLYLSFSVSILSLFGFGHELVFSIFALHWLLFYMLFFGFLFPHFFPLHPTNVNHHWNWIMRSCFSSSLFASKPDGQQQQQMEIGQMPIIGYKVGKIQTLH